MQTHSAISFDHIYSTPIYQMAAMIFSRSNYSKINVTILTSGGVTRKANAICIIKHGIHCTAPNRKESWILKRPTNRALLTKLGRQYIILYGPKNQWSSFWTCTARSTQSHIWKSIVFCHPTLILGACWQVGKGDKFDIMNPWIPRLTEFWIPQHCITGHITKVSDLLHDLFYHHTDAAVLQIRRPSIHRVVDDRWMWTTRPNGIFTIKSTYQKIRQSSQLPSAPNEPWVNPVWKLLWKVKKITPQTICLSKPVPLQDELHRWIT